MALHVSLKRRHARPISHWAHDTQTYPVDYFFSPPTGVLIPLVHRSLCEYLHICVWVHGSYKPLYVLCFLYHRSGWSLAVVTPAGGSSGRDASLGIPIRRLNVVVKRFMFAAAGDALF